jgi:hypothetical protein
VAIRSAVVRPDSIISGVDGGDILMASRDAILDAVVRAVDTMILTGGQFTVSSQRVPTGFANESVCAAAFVTWQNHPSAKAQPEPTITPEMVGAGEVEELARATEAYNAELQKEALQREDAEDEALDEADVEPVAAP